MEPGGLPRQTKMFLTVWQIDTVAETFMFPSLSREFGDICVTELVTPNSQQCFSARHITLSCSYDALKYESVFFNSLSGWSLGLSVKWGIKVGVGAVQESSAQVEEGEREKNNPCDPTVALGAAV